MIDPEPYATLCVRWANRGAVAREAIAYAADQLDALGALVAEDPDVGGVETRDPATLESSERAELWVYLRPEACPRVEARVRELGAAMGLELELRTQIHAGDEWRDRWKAFYAARVLGDGALLLRPSWIERRAGDPVREIVLDPGRAFGTGRHETTRLGLDALVAHARDAGTPARILDLGCGSGILALVAARLFERARVDALDVDPEATETTRENVQLNGLADRIAVRTGTLESIADRTWDLVIANIRSEVLIPLAPLLAVCTAGEAILGGILTDERAAVLAAYAAAGLDPIEQTEAGEWVGLRLRRSRA
jgi:ribosomal protein L11 methyltransferase